MYLLRWRFDFLNHPTKYGQWSRSATRLEDMAAFALKEGLVRASIEGKHIETREIKTFAEVDGWDYCVFKWMAIASGPAFVKGSVTPVSRIVGLKIVAREREIDVLNDGTVTTAPRAKDEISINYATYGK
jgi:hypothetical protein